MSNRLPHPDLTPEMLLRAYALGVFPMAETRDDPALYWLDPESRGIIPLDRFHVPRSLRKTLRQSDFRITSDLAFAEIVRACAEPAPGRRESWINATIFDLCCRLFAMGHAHSIEIWRGTALVGGLYGIALNAAFFGESMFSRETDASKIALVHLVARLRAGNYRLLDTQFLTDHLGRFGAIEIPRAEYRQKLASALAAPARFYGELPPGALEDLLTQSTTQIS